MLLREYIKTALKLNENNSRQAFINAKVDLNKSIKAVYDAATAIMSENPQPDFDYDDIYDIIVKYALYGKNEAKNNDPDPF